MKKKNNQNIPVVILCGGMDTYREYEMFNAVNLRTLRDGSTVCGTPKSPPTPLFERGIQGDFS